MLLQIASLVFTLQFETDLSYDRAPLYINAPISVKPEGGGRAYMGHLTLSERNGREI